MIVPANNVALEYDMYRMAPENMSFHSTRMRPSRNCEPDNPEKFRNELKQVYGLLKRSSDVVVYGRTYGTHKNVGIIREVFGMDVIIPEEAVIEYLQEYGIKAMWLGTPYIKERTDEEKAYFAGKSFNVTGSCGLNKIYALDIADTGLGEIRAMIDKNIDSVKNSEIIYISCTAMTTSRILDKLSMTYKKPVISENSAILWKISRITGNPVKIPGLLYI